MTPQYKDCENDSVKTSNDLLVGVLFDLTDDYESDQMPNDLAVNNCDSGSSSSCGCGNCDGGASSC